MGEAPRSGIRAGAEEGRCSGLSSGGVHLIESVMELRQLQLFLAAAEEGSITAAARRMNLTQPALSRQVKSLEEELGVELFTRGAHSVSLTPAGEVLRGETAKLLRFSEAMVEKVRTEAAGEPLRVAYAPSLSRPFISMAIERFTQFHRRVRVSLSDCSSAEMHAGLHAGKFDLVLTVPGGTEAVAWTPLRDYGWILLVPEMHGLATRSQISLAELGGEKLVVLDRISYPDYWERFSRFFRDHGLSPKIAGEFDGGTSLLAAVEAGMGLAVMGEASRPPDGCHRVVALAVTDDLPRIPVAAGIPSNRDTPPKVLAFIEELKRAAKEC